jgi:hypothetical protein
VSSPAPTSAPLAPPGAAARPPEPRPGESKATETKPAEAKPAEARPTPPSSRRRPDAGPRPGLADAVVLRDGTLLRGTLLRVEQGNYVLLLGIEGVRTIPWRVV